MVRSVDEILQQEFGKTFPDKGVHILDPFTGTGNFITRIMQMTPSAARKNLPSNFNETKRGAQPQELGVVTRQDFAQRKLVITGFSYGPASPPESLPESFQLSPYWR